MSLVDLSIARKDLMSSIESDLTIFTGRMAFVSVLLGYGIPVRLLPRCLNPGVSVMCNVVVLSTSSYWIRLDSSADSVMTSL